MKWELEDLFLSLILIYQLHLLEKKKEIILDFVDYKNINGNIIIKTISCYALYTESDNYL